MIYRFSLLYLSVHLSLYPVVSPYPVVHIENLTRRGKIPAYVLCHVHVPFVFSEIEGRRGKR